MLGLLWIVPALPLAGALALATSGSRLSRKVVTLIGTGSIGTAAVTAVLVAFSFISLPSKGHAFSQNLWTWIDVAGFRASISLYLDALALVMMLVVTGVGFLIHLYSAEFMRDEEGYSRFFAYMNLFVGSMLILVLADNLLLLYLGWEGVGLCSYLLIGFWYRDPANGYAARKAFLVTRVGDAAMAVGLFMLFTNLGTLQIQELMARSSQQWPEGSMIAATVAALLLAGALGKSAQLPFQTWLPDAMAGPTPVSALIHAATMVTAGVYLIARTNALFVLAPAVQSAVAVIGALTLLLAGFSALTQHDIKRALAYSTISQIGYMFLALGVGAWSAAIFHFMTHAFFKALLFLGAGVVILSLGREHDMFRMGGLRTRLPVTFQTFLIGAASLSALPLVTAGFYSKDLILWLAWSSEKGTPLLWLAGVGGALLTSLYTFRMVFLIFFGEAKSPAIDAAGPRMKISLVVLAFLSLAGGLVELPPALGGLPLFSDFMETTLPATAYSHDFKTEVLFEIIASVFSLCGIFLAYLFFFSRPHDAERLMSRPIFQMVHRLWYSGWGFDWLYERIFVRPFLWISRINKDDGIDLLYEGAAWYSVFFHKMLSRSQTGKVRWYAMGITLGAIVVIGMAVIL
ncbi:MAG TPA: NADH-quinone oxidoreductase subunit L [Thermodesulfovibrionales bacterium]|nr:NADH-quinone oxidoreductase subunit L [Thermodesulfovibrionales bacterium]